MAGPPPPPPPELRSAPKPRYEGEPHAWRAHLACGHANDLRPSWNFVVESNQGPYEGYCRAHDKFFKIVRFERYDPSPLRESEEQYAPTDELREGSV